MSEIDSGGFVFPVTEDAAMFPGLTKREYFAAMALQGLIVKLDFETNLDTYVEDSYKFADAMIRAGKGEK